MQLLQSLTLPFRELDQLRFTVPAAEAEIQDKAAHLSSKRASLTDTQDFRMRQVDDEAEEWSRTAARDHARKLRELREAGEDAQRACEEEQRMRIDEVESLAQKELLQLKLELEETNTVLRRLEDQVGVAK